MFVKLYPGDMEDRWYEAIRRTEKRLLGVTVSAFLANLFATLNMHQACLSFWLR